MKIGLISDVHGNLLALDRVLGSLGENKVDRIVCLGDVPATGPKPREVLSRLRELEIPVIMGNKDELLLRMSEDPSDKGGASDRNRAIDAWCAEQLSTSDLNFIRGFPMVLKVPLSSGQSLLCFHGSPKSNTDLILSGTKDDVLKPMLDGESATFMAGGHSHVQMFRMFGDSVLINPGSVGQAIARIPGSDQIRLLSWSEYALIKFGDDGIMDSVKFLRVPRDKDAELRLAVDCGMPFAQWWATR